MYNRASKCDIRFKLILVSDGGRLKELTFSLVCVFNGLAHHFHLLSFTAFSSFLNKKNIYLMEKTKVILLTFLSQPIYLNESCLFSQSIQKACTSAKVNENYCTPTLSNIRRAATLNHLNFF